MIVTGMPRTGTSLIAGILHACGVYVGDYTKGRGNPKGFFENPIWRRACYSVLMRGGVQPVGSIDPVYDIVDWPTILKAARQIQREAPIGSPWLVKHPFSLRCWPAIYKALPGAIWIITERDPKEALESAKKFFEFTPGEVCDGWLSKHARMIEDLKLSVDYITVKTSYADRSVDYYYDWVRSLGLPANKKAIKEFIT